MDSIPGNDTAWPGGGYDDHGVLGIILYQNDRLLVGSETRTFACSYCSKSLFLHHHGMGSSYELHQSVSSLILTRVYSGFFSLSFFTYLAIDRLFCFMNTADGSTTFESTMESILGTSWERACMGAASLIDCQSNWWSNDLVYYCRYAAVCPVFDGQRASIGQKNI